MPIISITDHRTGKTRFTTVKEDELIGNILVTDNTLYVGGQRIEGGIHPGVRSTITLYQPPQPAEVVVTPPGFIRLPHPDSQPPILVRTSIGQADGVIRNTPDLHRVTFPASPRSPHLHVVEVASQPDGSLVVRTNLTDKQDK